MPSLLTDLTRRVQAVFAALGLPAELGAVTVSNRPDLCQFQCNGAMPAAKVARKPPRAIAEEVVARLAQDPDLAKVEVAGPGFINIDVSDALLAARLSAALEDDRMGVAPAEAPASVLVDFGGPNIAKPMHVGHLRSSIIGDSLQRLFRFAGDRVVSDVHMGDWGLPIGMLISELALSHGELPYFDPDFSGPYPAESPVGMDDLEALYPKAAADCRANPARLEAARLATAELQQGRPGYRALWRHFFEVSKAGMERDFGALGVRFDYWLGEAAVNDLIPEMIAGLEAGGVVVESEGARVIPVAEPEDKAEIPPLILVKSDGGVMYGTTDLATIVDRVRRDDPDLILYVVDQRQHLHFEQVFRAARRGGLSGRARLEHIGFGTMNGTDGKPFKTRAGGVMKLQDLIAMVTDAARARLAEAGLAADYPEDERDAIARMVGIAALKFADLSNHRASNYVFDLDRFLRFEGKTGPYLQYAAVRMQSILRKAAEQGDTPGGVLPPQHEAERELALTLLRWPEAVAAACAGRTPNDLADFAYGLAQTFSRFYAACHILSEADDALRRSRLALAGQALRVLGKGLDLLGIEVPERM